MPSGSSEDSIVILGAGLSGLSLACAMLEAGVSRPLVLVDRRRSFGADRTWCTWLTGPLRFSECVTHRWPSWRVHSPRGQREQVSDQHPYVHLEAQLVYESALERLSRSAQVTVLTGEAVRGVDHVDGLRVSTSSQTLDAAMVFDAMGAGSPLASATPSGSDFVQRFLGWEIEVSQPVFNPAVATLMDFRPHSGPGVTFIYTLPFSPTRALIEHTSIEPRSAAHVDRAAALRRELTSQLGLADWRQLRQERGSIPMTSSPFPLRRANGVWTVGAAAGAIRPSSGYAFTRIQRHVDRVAAAVADESPLPGVISHPRYAPLDHIFLQALRSSRQPDRIFLATGSVPGATFARFMTDASTLADDAHLIRALPRVEMSRAALRAVSRWRR